MHGTPPDPRTPAGSPDIRVAGPPETPPTPKQDTPGPPRTAEPPRPGDEPRPHQGPEHGGAPARPAARPMPSRAADHGRERPRLLDEAEAGGFRDRWHVVQAAFVDDPADSARRAEELAAEVVNALGRAIADRKRVLDESARDGADGDGGEPPDTERLRRSLRAYHDLVDRLLAI